MRTDRFAAFRETAGRQHDESANILEADRHGKVYIVGAGPGAADLLTVRGMHALRRADVVLYDALVNPDLLDEAPACALKIFVGKRNGLQMFEQREIDRRIVAEAREGKTVVRLKGGDPLLFGRGGEEALACEEAGIDFEFIPGVTSALGAASHAGIPLTHRGIASSVAFITARDGADSQEHLARLGRLAAAVDTLVIFMGGSRIPSLVESLLAAGVAKSARVAVISNATLENQTTVLGSVEDISDRLAEARLAAPMLIIVGEVTNLASTLNWFERRGYPAEESPVFGLVANRG